MMRLLLPLRLRFFRFRAPLGATIAPAAEMPLLRASRRHIFCVIEASPHVVRHAHLLLTTALPRCRAAALFLFSCYR